MKYILLTTLIFSSLFSCDTLKSNKNAKEVESFSGVYKVEKLNESNVESHDLTVSFESTSNDVSGHSGCNNFFGNYSQNANEVSFSKLGSTKKLCPGAGAMTIEKDFLNALRKVQTAEMQTTGKILLKDETGLTILIAKEQ